MTNYDASMAYYTAPTRSGSAKNITGAVLGGALIGMNARYIPISKNDFVEKAFDIHRFNVETQISSLKNAAAEVEKNNLSSASKMLLQAHGLAEDVVQISDKCITLDKSICDETKVKDYKNALAESFDSVKKHAGLRNNEAAEAISAIKKSKFYWGMGIGVCVGLALSLLSSRD